MRGPRRRWASSSRARSWVARIVSFSDQEIRHPARGGVPISGSFPYARSIFYKGTGPAEDSAGPIELERPTGFEPARSSLGSWHSATELRPPGERHLTVRSAALLERHVVGLDQLVAARLPVEPAAGPVEVDLLVERYGRLVVQPQLVDAVVLLQALLVVHDRLRLVHHPVEVGVVVVREQVARAEERHIDALGVERALAPADQPHRPRPVHINHV